MRLDVQGSIGVHQRSLDASPMPQGVIRGELNIQGGVEKRGLDGLATVIRPW